MRFMSFLVRRIVAVGPSTVLVAVMMVAGCGGDVPAPSGDDGVAGDGEVPLPKVKTTSVGQVSGELAPHLLRVDPARDAGWQTEAFQDAAAAQLKELGELLAGDRTRITAKALEPLADPNCRFGVLRPGPLVPVTASGGVTVLRPKPAAGPVTDPASGLAPAASRLRELAGFGEQVKSYTATFKIVRVDATDQDVVTRVLFHADAQGTQRRTQQAATWECRWRRDQSDGPPKLLAVTASDFEEVVLVGERRRMFSDCTASVLGHNDSYRKQLLHGVDHWRSRLDNTYGPTLLGLHGFALGDVNGDGLDDLYLCQADGLPNRLFVQNADGTATDRSAAAGVDFLDSSYSALFLDMDNDGDEDLVVAMNWGLLLLANDGDGHFAPHSERRKRKPIPSAPSALAAADYDGDGLVDIYVCTYYAAKDFMGVITASEGDDLSVYPLPYHDANNGGANFLFRNNGDWELVNVTRESGLASQNNTRFSLAASWGDYDDDGDPDLYVANDYGRNSLFRNDNGRFTDVAAEAGVEDIAAGMSVSWGDVNGDGRIDLYVSNMFSSAGSRIAYQRNFKSGSNERLRGYYQRHARGNSLFENAGDGTFRDVSVERAVTMGRWAWGSVLIDLNNDGRRDIFVANGFLSQEDTGDL